MKRKTCMALLALSSGLMVFAADVDKCVEKFEACKVTCGNQKAQCMARGNTVEYCNSRLNECNADCNKDLKKCQGNAPAKPAPKPTPKPKK